MDVQLIRDSFAKAKPIAAEVVTKFYEILWQNYPASKELFAGVNMDQQKKALAGALVFTVDHIEDPDKLIPYLRKLGSRHVAYGTQEEHYGWVGESLLETFKHFLGDDWTTDTHNAWVDAYNFIWEKMVEGARNETSATPSEEPPAEEATPKNVVNINEKSTDTGQSLADIDWQVHLSEATKEEIRSTARDLVQQEIRAVFDRAVQDELRDFEGSLKDYIKKRLA